MNARKAPPLSCVVALLVTVPLVCFAGSGAHWKITVKNPTTHLVQAIAWYMSGNLTAEPVEANRVSIQPGGQYTFTVPGSWCPAGVTGEIYWQGHGYFVLQNTNCFGNRTLDGLPGTTCCSNLTFEICRKQGPSDDSTISNNDYGYCKK
jgi:hypothetical protein